MPSSTKPTSRKAVAYASAWLIYMLFAWFSFPFFSITVMLFSIALSMLGAWLYGYAGCVVTTALTIPYHYIMLRGHSNDPAIWHEAFNPFGISTQLLISCSIAVLRHTKTKIEHLNGILERKVEERTDELNRLRYYIIQNHETAQVLLSHMLLGDIGDSLSGMLDKSDVLLNRLVFKSNQAAFQAAKLNEMIKDSIGIVQNLEFVDHFFANKKSRFSDAVREVAKHYTETAGIQFDLNLHIEHGEIPKHIQHQLYRITREAITNAVRHGKASNVSIQLKIDKNAYHLSIMNDGLPMPENVEGGLGLKLMQHRTQQLGGSLHLGISTDGKTLLECSIPKSLE